MVVPKSTTTVVASELVNRFTVSLMVADELGSTLITLTSGGPLAAAGSVVRGIPTLAKAITKPTSHRRITSPCDTDDADERRSTASIYMTSAPCYPLMIEILERFESALIVVFGPGFAQSRWVGAVQSNKDLFKSRIDCYFRSSRTVHVKNPWKGSEAHECFGLHP